MDALIPLKRLDQAKTRLRECLDPGQRVALMRTLLERTAGVATCAPSVSRVILVSSDPNSRALARRLEIAHFDDHGLPWNDALAAAMKEAVVSSDALILSADLPLVSTEAIEALIALSPDRGVGVARARDAGTNALVMRPSGAAGTCFGAKGSAAEHAALAAAAGLRSTIVDISGLALDLDSPDDLREILRHGVSDEVRAILTAADDRALTCQEPELTSPR